MQNKIKLKLSIFSIDSRNEFPYNAASLANAFDNVGPE